MFSCVDLPPSSLGLLLEYTDILLPFLGAAGARPCRPGVFSVCYAVNTALFTAWSVQRAFSVPLAAGAAPRFCVFRASPLQREGLLHGGVLLCLEGSVFLPRTGLAGPPALLAARTLQSSCSGLVTWALPPPRACEACFSSPSGRVHTTLREQASLHTQTTPCPSPLATDLRVCLPRVWLFRLAQSGCCTLPL